MTHPIVAIPMIVGRVHGDIGLPKAVVPCLNEIILKNFGVARNRVWNEI